MTGKQVLCFEKYNNNTHQRIPKVYFTNVPAELPILSDMFTIFFAGGRKIWSLKRQFSWNKANFEMSPISSGWLRPFEMSDRRILNEWNNRIYI
jgi:hypothetical protein